jgi:hypothetical protein
MGSRRETANIGKIQVKRDEKSLFLTGLLPNGFVCFTGKTFISDSIALMPHLAQKFCMSVAHVFIQFDEHCFLT